MIGASVAGGILFIIAMTWICWKGIELSARSQVLLLGTELIVLAIFAVIAFSKTIAREMARHQITVNVVCPGPTDTALFASMGGDNPALRDGLTRAIPLRRLAAPEDIANAVAFFASEEASFITGQTLSVSGGLTMS